MANPYSRENDYGERGSEPRQRDRQSGSYRNSEQMYQGRSNRDYFGDRTGRQGYADEMRGGYEGGYEYDPYERD